MADTFWFLIMLAVVIAFVVYVVNRTSQSKHTPAIRQKEKETFEKVYDNDGIFLYKENGFDIRLKDEATSVDWNDIDTIFAYKADLMTYDQLVMEVILKNAFSFRITEETEGWYQFIKKIKEVFPAVKQDFEMDLMFPAFATNLMIVYDAKGRSIEEFVKEDKKQ